MAIGMEDKGYQFPLHSLDLINDSSQLLHEPRYCIPVPQGRLVVRKELRVRGMKVGTEVCDQAVCTALAYHEKEAAGFAAFRLDAAWTESMRAWRERMIDRDFRGLSLQTDRRLGTERLQALAKEGRGVWARLSLCARLCGLSGVLIQGRAPRARLKLADALGEAAGRAREYAEPLARCGFGPAQQEQVRALIAALSEEHRQAGERRWQQQRHRDVLVVVRGALLGDLSLFSEVALQVLGPEAAQAVQVQRLLGQRPRR